MSQHIDYSIRAWLRRMEQAWNCGDLAGCAASLGASVTLMTQTRGRTISGVALARWMRSTLPSSLDCQAQVVIESTATAHERVEVVMRVNLRCLRGGRLDEARFHATLQLRQSMTDEWTLVGVDLRLQRP
ncbi:MAG: hypothetical protein IPK19_05370 [Chloroflexi bacterium]|nr:hypothetical protein [Chloroflexota bacterium]